MKKLFSIMSAVLALAACSKGELAEIEEQKQDNAASNPVTFNITVDDMGTKALKSKWAVGDVIYIHFDNNTKSIGKFLTITYNGSTWVPQAYNNANPAVETTFVESDFTDAKKKLGAVHFPIEVDAHISSNILYFKKKNTNQTPHTYCLTQSQASYTVSGSEVNIKLNLQKPDNLVLFHVPGIQANASDYTLKITNSEDAVTRVPYISQISEYGAATTQSDMSGQPIPGFADADGVIFSAWINGSALGSNKDWTFTLIGPDKEYMMTRTVTLNAGYQYSFKAPDAADTSWKEKKVGTFLCSETKSVYIAPGNLQATTNDNGATWTWRFAEHPWDYIGNNTANNCIQEDGTVTTNGTVDLFYWVGSTSSLNPYGIISGHNLEDYCGTSSAEGLKADWGHNAIVNGGNTPDMWRTPSAEEWGNILWGLNRTGYKSGFATVNGVQGIIILPDGFDNSIYIYNSATATDGHNPYQNNVISYVDWMNNFEVNGAVFLPVTGYRENSTVTGTTYHGRYWTSTHRDGGKSAYKFWFDNGGNGKGRWDVHEPWSTADNGFAVRLIRDVE